MAFALGSLVGKISYHFTSRSAASQNSEENSQPSSASLSAQSENWGLGFQEEGTRPSGNASIEELEQYNAWYAQDTDEKIIYLTFDAGYENGNMPAILDALHKHQVHATFFVVGTLIREKPELIREISDAGHTVGNHTMTHPDMSGISTKEAFQKQLEDVEALYKDATGNEMTKFYRPPQGIYSTDNLQMAKDLGYSTFFWSLAYVDWYQDKQPSKEEAFQKLLGRIHPGAIVLLHSTSSTNAEILDELLTKWKEMGYTFGTLEELVKSA
ncbi:polysaccharide deacetylase family protein [Blautia schinkii]|nr:polysaccharide deacetylase family protein [Blautia schinkii]NSK23987.1 polysaccharide deacetylase family protein [Blautia schinkii]NSK27024.1 polysaccharide deacetylase family protein [Blautia schinkii]NSK33292.1 polysaccharide deacetylase family protein [Blautia schinkii]NSK50777.1 polysaccharide deacetylase family protein [Blautia schinkii]